MNSTMRALVITFEGPELSNSEIAACFHQIAQSVNVQHMYQFGPEDIAKTIFVDVITNAKISDTKDDDKTPEEHAIIYIGTLFQNELEKKDLVNFVTAFGIAFTNAYIYGTDQRLVKATKLISDRNSNSTIRASILRKYHITTGVLDVITRIGKRHVQNN